MNLELIDSEMANKTFLDEQKLNLFVNGYIRLNISIIIPDVIIDVITTFYDVYIPFMVYNEKYELMYDNINGIRKLYLNRLSKFMTTNMNDVYFAGDNSEEQFGAIFDGFHDHKSKTVISWNSGNICDDGIVLISQGMANKSCFMYTKDNKLYMTGKDINISSIKSIGGTLSLIDSNIFKDNLKDIQCGGYHGLFLTMNNKLYGCGKNGHHQLGFKDTTSKGSITKIMNVYGSHYTRVKMIGCTFQTSIVIDRNSCVNTFGSNNFGECGVGRITYPNTKAGVNVLNINIKGKVKYISCGCHHIGALTEDSQVYMFGENDGGQCGVNNDGNAVYSPTKLMIPNVDQIIQLKCGGYHTIIKTNTNDYYSFGKNRNNECLLNNFNGKPKSVFIPYSISMEYINKLCGNDKIIVDILPGYKETFILKQV